MPDKFGKKLVVDSNVLVKILVPENDTRTAQEFLSFCNQHKIGLVVPTLFNYEVISVCTKKGVSVDKVLALLDIYQQNQLIISDPSRDDWLLAEKICQDGNDKSGHPSMYDSIYHAMAINRQTIFVTADNRHFVKAKQHGSIKLLENWQTLFS